MSYRKCYLRIVELHLSGHWLPGSAWPFGEISREFYPTILPWNYRLSDQVHYSVMASRSSYQAWSKGLDTLTVNSNSRTSNCHRSIFLKKNSIILICYISAWLAVPINPDKCSSAVYEMCIRRRPNRNFLWSVCGLSLYIRVSLSLSLFIYTCIYLSLYLTLRGRLR